MILDLGALVGQTHWEARGNIGISFLTIGFKLWNCSTAIIPAAPLKSDAGMSEERIGARSCSLD